MFDRYRFIENLNSNVRSLEKKIQKIYLYNGRKTYQVIHDQSKELIHMIFHLKHHITI